MNKGRSQLIRESSMKYFALTCFLLILLLPGCEKKTAPVVVGQMSEYRDPGYGFSIQYPQEWKQLGTTGKAVFVKSQEVLNRFLDPTTGEPGGEVSVVAKKPDVWQASANLETVSNSPVFTMQYPDNLGVASVTAREKANKDYVLELRADRQDCSIHIDVFGAQKLTVDKVWAQNKGKYKAKGTGETTIDGAKAYWVDYSPVKDISSRAYFAVKNDKVVRIS